MKQLPYRSLRSVLALTFALGALPLLQGCDDDDSDNPDRKNAWMPVEFQIISVGTGSSGAGGSGSGSTGG